MKTSLKYILSVSFVILTVFTAFAQRPLEIMVNITPPYPLDVNEYIENYEGYTVTIINHSFNDQQIYMHAELVGDNGVGVDVDDNYRPDIPFTVGAKEIVTITGAELRDINASMTTSDINTIGFSQVQLALGLLPEGNYEMCIRAFDWDTAFPMTTGCSFEFQTNFGEVPFIISPFEDEEMPVILSASFPIIWEAPGWDPMVAMGFEYELKIVDLTLHGDTDLEDLFSDHGVAVVLDQMLMGNLYNYNGDGSDPPLEEGHRYGLRVKVIDPMGEVEFQNGQYSEIRTFWYGSNPVDPFDDLADLDLDLPDDCASRCDVALPDNLNLATNPASFSSLYIGYFELENIVNLENVNGTWSGNADLRLPFLNNLRVEVELDTFTVNTQGQIISGLVKGMDEASVILDAPFFDNFKFVNDAIDSAQDMAGNTSFTSAISDSISAQVGNFLMETRMLSGLIGANSVGLPIGFTQSIGGNDFTLGITDLKISPTAAKVKVVAGTSLAMFPGDNWLLFVGEEVCFHPQGFGGDYTLALGQDLVFQKTTTDEDGVVSQSDNSMSMAFKGVDNMNASSTQIGTRCELRMSCDGLEGIDLVGEVKFPKNTIVPELADGTIGTEKVIGTFGFTLDKIPADSIPSNNGSNWLIALDMERFQLKGLKNWSFEIDQAYLDMSAISNPSSISFPEQYHTQDETFEGVYIKHGFISPPGEMSLGARTQIDFTDVIIDPTVWMDVKIRNVLGINQGGIDGWRMAIDSMGIEIANNNLSQGYMNGRLHMPILDDTTYLNYSAAITNPAAALDVPGINDYWNFNFTVRPSDTIVLPVFIADATIFDDSVFEINMGFSEGTSSYIDSYIHANMSINSDRYYPDDMESLSAPFRLPSLDFTLAYHSEDGFDDDRTSISFASPQKSLGGFPVSISGFELEGGAETLNLGFDVEINWAEGEEDMGVGAHFTIESNMTMADVVGAAEGAELDWQSAQQLGNGGLGLAKKFSIDRVRFDSLYFDVVISGAGLKGYAGFYNNPLPDGGRDKGVRGMLDVILPMGLQGRLEAQFGTYGTPPVDQTTVAYDQNYFPYWRVDATVLLPEPIPLGGLPLGIAGFGGGLFKNMEKNGSPQFVEGVIQGSSAYRYGVDTYNSFGFEVEVMFAMTNKPEAFNADLHFGATFQNGGLDQITIGGAGYFMCAVDKRPEAKVTAGFDMVINLNNPDLDAKGQPIPGSESFSMDGELFVMLNMVTRATDGDGEPTGPELFSLVGDMQGAPQPNTFVQAYFHADNDSWFFKMGLPEFNYNDNHDPRGSARLRIPGVFSLDLKTYLMLGNDIPTQLPPLPPDIERILNNPSGDATTAAADATAAQGNVNQEQIATGSGFAHGVSTHISVDIDAYLLYATLDVYQGYDMNLTQRNVPCGNTGELPGINGWYAQGQIYAGLEGGLGLKIRLFGEERRFHLVQLAAALALQGGGPKPFYFKGRASVYYEVLGGALSGEGSFTVKVGEACVPEIDNPFAGINFYESIKPEQNDQDVFVGKTMMVKLALPVDRTFTIPAIQEDGTVVNERYRPYLSYELLRPNGSVQSVNATWANDTNHEQLHMIPVQAMNPNRDYRLKLTVTAFDYQTRKMLEVEGRPWSQDTTITFRTGAMPKDIYNFVQFTKPLEMERFYLQDDESIGLIKLSQLVDRDFYFPESTGLSPHTYFVRLTNLNNGDSQDLELEHVTVAATGEPWLDDIRFYMPQLENSALYAMQIIRKGAVTILSNIGTLTENGKKTRTLKEISSDVASTTLKLNNDAIVAPGETTANGEFLLYHTYFHTSQYNRLSEKMAGFSRNITYGPSGGAHLGSRIKVNYTGGEKFERRSFRRFKPNNTNLAHIRYSERIRTLDPFNRSYHTSASGKIWDFKVRYNNEIKNNFLNWDFPNNLNIDWSNNTSYDMPRANIQGNFANALSQAEVEVAWGNYLHSVGLMATAPDQIFNIGNSDYIDINTGQVMPKLEVLYDTHYKVEWDKTRVKDWAMNYAATRVNPGSSNPLLFGDYLENYSFWNNKLHWIRNNYLLLGNTLNQGQYRLQFVRNTADHPDFFDWSLTGVYVTDFYTPHYFQLQYD